MITVGHVKPWFVRTLPLHGVSESEYAAYLDVLSRVAAFLDEPPSRWTRGDLRRFYAQHAAALHHDDIVRWRRALGILAEVLQKMPAPRRPRAEVRSAPFRRTPSQTSRVLNDPTENEIVGWDAPSPGTSRPVTGWDAFDDEDAHSSSLDALITSGESSRDFASDIGRPQTGSSSGFERRTTQSGFGPWPVVDDDDDSILIVVDEDVEPRTGDISSLDITGQTSGVRSDDVVAAFFGDAQTGSTPAADRHETPPPFDRRRSVTKTAELEAVRRGTPATPFESVAQDVAIDHDVDPRGWVELRWRGFVAGDALRRELVTVSQIIDSRGLFGVLANMRGASVLGQQDTRWFCEWIVDCVQRGVQRLALVSPSNPTARLQLSRLARELRADWFAAPVTQRFQLEFFHHSLAARTWLES